MQEQKLVNREKLLGKWLANDITPLFKDKEDTAIARILHSLESGEIKLEQLWQSSQSLPPVTFPIQLEFFESGEMAMSILQSMLPNAPMTMQLNMTITWKLDGDQLLTQTLLDEMEAKITINEDAQLTAEQKEALRQQIPDLEAQSLAEVRKNPQMNRLNIVSVFYSSDRYFLTKSEEGNWVLHERLSIKTRELIKQYFECINTQDWDTWVSLFDDNVVMDEALSGHMEGRQAMKDSAKGIQEQFSKFENHIQEIVVEDERGMVVCRIEAVTVGGAVIESVGANFYRIANGKITYMASFHDRTPFTQAFSSRQSIAAPRFIGG
ncbi:MAG: hypothetical protein GPI92_01445 [Microcystis aeruginosa K13-06]|nr:hypothetical protein [Microcystis aeruginosa K13-06]